MPGPVNQIEARRVDGSLGRLGRTLWPGRCLLCDAGGAAGHDLCVACAAGLPWARLACPRCALPLSSQARACGTCLRKAPVLDAAYAAFLYRAPVDRLLPRLKFHGDLAAGRFDFTFLHLSLPDVAGHEAHLGAGDVGSHEL